MSVYEYRVVPAPIRIKPARGESRADALAAATQRLLAEMSAQGWDYLGRDRAPVEVKRGWFGRVEHGEETLLTFRREARVTAPISAGRAHYETAPEPRLGHAATE